MSETKNIEVNVYRTPNGVPTCCRNYRNKEYCFFLGFRNQGIFPVCLYSGNDIHRETSENTEETKGLGFMSVNKDCPIWKDQ